MDWGDEDLNQELWVCKEIWKLKEGFANYQSAAIDFEAYYNNPIG